MLVLPCFEVMLIRTQAVPNGNLSSNVTSLVNLCATAQFDTQSIKPNKDGALGSKHDYRGFQAMPNPTRGGDD